MKMSEPKYVQVVITKGDHAGTAWFDVEGKRLWLYMKQRKKIIDGGIMSPFTHPVDECIISQLHQELADYFPSYRFLRHPKGFFTVQLVFAP